jgi:hypothetical protein
MCWRSGLHNHGSHTYLDLRGQRPAHQRCPDTRGESRQKWRITYFCGALRWQSAGPHPDNQPRAE